MKYNDNGEYKDIYVKSFDTLPIGTEVDYDGNTVPDGWTEVSDYDSDWVSVGENDFNTKYKKVGNVVTITCFSPANYTVAGYTATLVGRIPAALKPTSTVRSGVYARGNNNMYCQATPDNNNIIIFNWGNAVTYTDAGQLAFTLTYVI